MKTSNLIVLASFMFAYGCKNSFLVISCGHHWHKHSNLRPASCSDNKLLWAVACTVTVPFRPCHYLTIIIGLQSMRAAGTVTIYFDLRMICISGFHCDNSFPTMQPDINTIYVICYNRWLQFLFGHVTRSKNDLCELLEPRQFLFDHVTRYKYNLCGLLERRQGPARSFSF